MNGYYSGQRFRSGLFSFIAGRLGSGLLGFVNFLLLVRVLSAGQYGSYVTAIAFVEMVLVLSLIGTDWVAIRNLPEYRAKANARTFLRFVQTLIAVRLSSLVLCALAVLFLANLVSGWIGLDAQGPLVVAVAGLLLVEGLARFTRDVLLDSLILQRASQLSLISKNLLMGTVLLLALTGEFQLDSILVVLVETACAAIGLVIAGFALVRHLASPMLAVVDPQWIPRHYRELWRSALGNYLANLVSQLSSANMIQVLVARALDPGAAAAFGFARQLTDQMRKYLPSEMFLGLIRPMIIARYSENRSVANLCQQLATLLKLALTPVMLALIVFSAGGAPLLELLGGGAYGAATPILLAFLLVLVVFQLRRNLELLLITIERSSLLVLGALAALIGLPTALLALQTTGHPVAGVLGVLVGEVCAVAVIVWQLQLDRLGYRFPARELTLFIVSGSLFAALAHLVMQWLPGSLLSRLVVSAVCVIAFFLSLWYSRVLAPAELDLLQRLRRGRAA